MKIINKNLLKEKLDKRQGELLKSGHIGYCEIIVKQNGETVYHESFNSEKNTMYRLASMTKAVTSVAVLSEVDKGRLSLKDKVSKFLPGFADQYVGTLDENRKPIPKEHVKNEIIVEQLLNHTNGLFSDIDGVGAVQDSAMSESDRQNLASAAYRIERSLLSFQPGEYAFYSATAAHSIAARIVEITSGLPFDKYVQENIMKPLGITDITFCPTEEQWGRMKPFHCFDGEKTWTDDIGKHTFENFPILHFCGGASLCGTAEAYSEFAEMLLNDGRNVLTPESLALLKKAYVPISWNPEDSNWWGLGVRVIANDNYILPKNSFGWSGAYGTHFWVDPDNRITAVYMKNSRYDGGAGAQTACWFEQDVVESMM